MTDYVVNMLLQGCGRIYAHVYADDIDIYKNGQCRYIPVTVKKER